MAVDSAKLLERDIGISKGAQISAAVDGTPGSNDMPGRLVFSTTADGSASPTERLRIDSVGSLLLGHTAALTVNSSQHRFQLIGTDYATSGLSQQRFQAGASGEHGGGEIVPCGAVRAERVL